jgi:hypothetical protein
MDGIMQTNSAQASNARADTGGRGPQTPTKTPPFRGLGSTCPGVVPLDSFPYVTQTTVMLGGTRDSN